ncbi:MAG: protein kinase, partial [Alkalinema sp. RL_2_19]|nr:protein kinase [Alkalinema sp. RL_2_19]
ESCFAAGNPELESLRLLDAMVDLCQIVAYAHSRGVLHRDLKPVNVMLGAFGETLVLDWGLAKVEDRPDDPRTTGYVRPSGSGSSATQAGAVLGSPPYLSPEAASGRIEEIDQASDVYLLGATLYEVLTCRPPRQGSSHYEILDLARTSDPPAPRTINKSVPRPLEAICRKAMARRKADRYHTAMEMATDLRRFLASDRVAAYQERPLERLARWARRHRRAIGYAAIAWLLLGSGLFGVAKWREAQQLRAYDQGAQEVAEFRRLASDVHFLAASSDPISEEVPYYQTGAGERVGRQALALSEHWGTDLSRLSLGPDPIQDRQERDRLKQEIYDLLLLMVQSRLHEFPSEETATESLVVLERARQLTEPTSSLFRLQAECFLRLEQVEQVADAQRRFSDTRTPQTAQDHFLHGEAYRQKTLNVRHDLPEDERHAINRQCLQQAVTEFELATDKAPRHYWARLQLGRCLMALGKYSEAIQTFGGCIAIRADQPWAYTSRGLAYALAGDRDRAVEELNRQIELSAAFQPVLHLNRGFLHLLRHDDEKALADFNRIMEADDQLRLSGAAYYRCQIRERYGDDRGALADLNWLIDTDPAFARAYVARARLLFKLGRTETAMDDLETYLSRTTSDFDAHSWVAHYGRGQLLLEIRESISLDNLALQATLESKALREFQQAVDFGGDVAELFQQLGRIHYLRGDPQAALASYEQGLVHSPQSASLHLSRGWLYAESDQPAAVNAFQAALQQDAQNPEALAALGYLQAKTKAIDSAERLAMESLLLGTKNYLELFNIACIHGELGESDPQNKERHHRDAMAVIRRALVLWKDDGAPTERSIPKLVDRERTSTFRSLQLNPEFGQLFD